MSNLKRSSAVTYSLFTALVLSASLAGCNGSSDGDDNKGGGGGGGGSTTPVGTGTGVGGAGHGPAPVSLGTAGTFVILTQSGITNTGTHNSAIKGNIGSSPITAAAMDNIFCPEITGTIFGINAAYTGNGDKACFAGTAADKVVVDNAVLDMGTAYNDAAGRTLPDVTELNSGEIGGFTLAPGLYKWGAATVSITNDVTLKGGPNDVWIFQIAKGLTMASAKNVTLAGGALAKNIFWQVAGDAGVTLGTTAHFEGIVLALNKIVPETGASVNGRLLSQKAVTLDHNAVTQPAP